MMFTLNQNHFYVCAQAILYAIATNTVCEGRPGLVFKALSVKHFFYWHIYYTRPNCRHRTCTARVQFNCRIRGTKASSSLIQTNGSKTKSLYDLSHVYIESRYTDSHNKRMNAWTFWIVDITCHNSLMVVTRNRKKIDFRIRKPLLTLETVWLKSAGFTCISAFQNMLTPNQGCLLAQRKIESNRCYYSGSKLLISR